ncbi:unnamed protein product, partial [Pylaiella littoralis]
SLFVPLLPLCLAACLLCLSTNALPQSLSLYLLLFYFIFCLSSVDHVVTGSSPWFAFALVCRGPGPWFDVRSTSKYMVMVEVCLGIFCLSDCFQFLFFVRACYFFLYLFGIMKSGDRE